MDCCELASAAIKVAAFAVFCCLVLAAVVVLIAFQYAFKGKFGNKEISAKPTAVKNVPSKEKEKKIKISTSQRTKPDEERKRKYKKKTLKRKRSRN